MPPSATTELNSHEPNTAPLKPGLAEKHAKNHRITFPKPPTFTNKYEERTYQKGRLAAAFRIFGKYGYDEGVAGHITLRDPVDPTTFWVNPFGVAFSLMKASDLIQVDHHGKIVDGGPVRLLNTAAFMIHSAIHNARPDVMCAAHAHTVYGRSFCSLGKPLDIITQDSCSFYEDHVLYESFNGVVLAEQEGIDIAACLGDKKAALLQNHGLLTVGQSVEAAVFWFVALDKCCHAQLMADAAAAGRGIETQKVGDVEAAFTYQTIGTPLAGWFSAKPMFDQIHAETRGEYLG